MAKLRYPIGIQSFKSLREGDYIYVDKTEFIHQLVAKGKYYFLSRPRRFGKSLLISTIDEYFRGNRQLFTDLAISRYDYDWESYPVFHLDLSGCRYDTPEALYRHLCIYISRWEREYGIAIDSNLTPEVRFQELVIQAHAKTGRQVVILIDEYDKPLLETVNNTPLQDSYRSQLRAFYSNLKSQDAHIRFAMLTGVTKFGHLSIFSDLNNLNDISLNREFSGICGVTKEELLSCFMDGIRVFADSNGMSEEMTLEGLRSNYDGYHFSKTGSPDIYNPFSLLNALFHKEFGDYWFQTGTPTFLIRMLKDRNLPLQELDRYETSVSSLMDVSFDLGNPIPVLYQSGYLTIKGYDPEFDSVILSFPNREVAKGFYDQLLPIYTSLSGMGSAFEIGRFVREVRGGNTEAFMRRLQSLFADFQYDAFDLGHLEQHYQDVLYIIYRLMGFYTHVEYKTATGRIDMVVETPLYLYVFEFKVDKTAQDALDQIDTKEYMIPFRADGRKLVKVGVCFSSAKRGIEDWKIG